MTPAVGRTCLLYNPRAGSADRLAAVRDRLATLGVEVIEVGPADAVADLARAAAERGYDTVAVAGGDGTVHSAAVGLIAAARPATLAVLPMGTGNDLCRTLDIPLDPAAAADLLRTATPRQIDVVRVTGGPGGYLVNAATGGFSGKVAAEVTPELKATWGPLAYLRGAVGPVTDPPVYTLTLQFDDSPAERYGALNVVVANARTAAGGFPVAPTADPEDGLLDVVLVHAGGPLDLTVVAARLMHGDYTHDENVTHRRARRVELISDPPLPLSLDGERCVCDRVTFAVVPKALRVLTGPGYHPTPEPEPPVEAEDDSDPPDATRPRLSARLFGLLAAGLLLAKRTPGWAVTGVGIATLSAVLFAWLARGVAGSEWRQWDHELMAARAEMSSPALDRLAILATWPGDAAGTAVLSVMILAAFLWRKQYITAAAFAAAVGGVVLLEWVLKPAFGTARPDLFPRTVEAGGYSFPSGHAMRAVAMFGFLAAVCAARAFERGRPIWYAAAAVCVTAAVGVCWSRVHLGVHWPTDVVAGALAAAAWVSACLVARRYAMSRDRKKPAE